MSFASSHSIDPVHLSGVISSPDQAATASFNKVSNDSPDKNPIWIDIHTSSSLTCDFGVQDTVLRAMYLLRTVPDFSKIAFRPGEYVPPTRSILQHGL